MAPPLTPIAAAVRSYAGVLRAAQQQVAAHNDVVVSLPAAWPAAR